MKCVIDNSVNLSYTDLCESVHPELSEHGQIFHQRIYEVIPGFYSAVGYGLANSILIVGTDDCILVDCTESLTSGKKIFADFLKITTKPITTIIYTHHHLDHIGGVNAFVNNLDIEIEIIAHETLMDDVRKLVSLVGPINNARGVYTFGLGLEHGPNAHVQNGLGPCFAKGTTTLLKPTMTFKDRLEITRSGMKMLCFHAPAETTDAIVIWFPDSGVILTGDQIQGPCCPNVCSIRGTPPRDAKTWYKSIDIVRKLKPDHMIPSHGQPVSGRNEVNDILTAYRDALQFTHDQTVRYMNKGYSPDELVQVIFELPPHLKNHPWLKEFYGSVSSNVRDIYRYYMGWFNGDPTFLNPLPPTVRSQGYIRLMGGRDSVYTEALNAYSQKQFQWCAELLTLIITCNSDDIASRNLKAKALHKLAIGTINTNWRNWYLTSEAELQGTLNIDRIFEMDGVDSTDIINALHIENFLECLCVRIDSAKTWNLCSSFIFQITEDLKSHSYELEIRQGIVEIHDPPLNLDSNGIIIDDQNIRNLFTRKIQINVLFSQKQIRFLNNTTKDDVQNFFSYFDLDSTLPMNQTLPRLV